MVALVRISCALGAWAIIAPFVFPWDVCLWVWLAGIIPGALVLVLCGVFALNPRRSLVWLCWAAVFLGVWLIVSPFLAGYALVLDVVWSNFLPGALIAVLTAIGAFMVLRSE
ncbi:MAG: SPW repeat protein [Anaerolineae bacterium]|jgi:hypothetical protein